MLQKIKYDLLIIICICFIAILFILYPVLFSPKGTAYVTVYQNGAVYCKYPLADDRTISVTDERGYYNLLLINNATVKMSDAECPDKLCIKQGAISKNGESIICLPHKVVVQISSEEESDLDAITN